MERAMPILVLTLLLNIIPCSWAKDERLYVGTERCKECHEQEYINFTSYAKKAHSYSSILRLKNKLTQEELRTCFQCHTTGYGKPGGFKSEEETPHLKDTGCEVCHGPGSRHVETQDPKDIRRTPSLKECEVCHNPERVGAFRYKPLIRGGAH